MRFIALLVIAVALVLATPVSAAPDVDQTINPFTTFAVYRILPNQRETLLGTASIDETNGDAIIRATAQAAARQNRTNNPSWRIVIYGPIDPPLTWYTNGDRIWDSATDL
jgi:hypothetical protein